MIQYASRAQLKEKARDQMAGHYGNAILLSICRSLIVFSLTFAISMTFTMILTVRTLMGGKHRDISDGISAFDSHYDFSVDFRWCFSDRHHIILSEYCLRQTCCDCQSVLRLQILIQKIARDLRSTDPAEYGMYTSV